MATAREIMHVGAECIGENDSLADAARRMRDLHVGAMPICGEDDRLHGIITDRDIVVRCVAEGTDPSSVTARQLAQNSLIWVDVNADHQEVLRLMGQHKLRRLPVIEDHRLVGMISEADVAMHMSEEEIAAYTRTIYAAPANA